MVAYSLPERRRREEGEGWPFIARFMLFMAPTTLIVTLWLFLNVNMGKQKHMNGNKRMESSISSVSSSKSSSAWTPTSTSSSKTTELLYNLDNDPYEETNIIDESSSEDLVNHVTDVQSIYSKLVVSPMIPTAENMYETFEANGGITPWLSTDTTTSSSLKKQVKYQTENAPHIVFVLVADWGWNDVGWRSNYMSWTTPHLDALAAEGVKLDAHYSQEKGCPTRGAILTGRYPLRLGLQDWIDDLPQAELPLTESTMAQELQSAGYRTHMVGKWDLGFSTTAHNPINRGFDSYYGHYSSYIQYWNKEHEGFLDLQNDLELVTNADEISEDVHLGYLYNKKVEAIIEDHATNYAEQPLFLYYSIEMLRKPWSAPTTYSDRCGKAKKIDDDDVKENYENYCGLNVMLDEALANVTCALNTHNMAENTILVLVSDSGGYKTMIGNNYPLKGTAGTFFRGGVSSTAFVHSPLIGSNYRGVTYTGTMHVVDWLPTLMHVATNGAWKTPLSGNVIDGVDLWDEITKGDGSGAGREEIVFYATEDKAVIQQGSYKYFLNVDDEIVEEPLYVFKKDKKSSYSSVSCANPSLITATTTTTTSS